MLQNIEALGVIFLGMLLVLPVMWHNQNR